MTESSDIPPSSETGAEERPALAASPAAGALIAPAVKADLADRDDLAIVACLTGSSDDDAIFLPALDYCQIPSRIVREPGDLAAQLDEGAGLLLIAMRA